jgi:hypothetical protein
MPARIYKPTRSVMQSGTGKTDAWFLEFEQDAPRGSDPLMGWTSSNETKTQVKLRFETRAEAEAYAQKQGLAYAVQTEPPVRLHKKSYSDNFKYGRSTLWTH